MIININLISQYLIEAGKVQLETRPWASGSFTPVKWKKEKEVQQRDPTGSLD